MRHASVSIIICTRDRAQSLRHTLASMRRCVVPSGLCTEVLVVDNGSVDHTQRVVAETQLANLKLRYISEPRKGKGHAYNTGMREARGGVLLFTDDDVFVPPDWIERMSAPIRYNLADAVQGKIVCELPGLPKFFDAAKLGGFAEVDFGTEGRLIPGCELVGANMAFSKCCVEQIGCFNTLLGPGACGFFDDTEFSWRLAAAGFRVWYEPGAAVLHRPLSGRLSWLSLRNQWLRHGISSYVATSFCPSRRPAESVSLFRRILRGVKVMALESLIRRNPRITQDEMFMWMQLGSFWAKLRGIRRIAKSLNEVTVQPPLLLCSAHSLEARVDELATGLPEIAAPNL